VEADTPTWVVSCAAAGRLPAAQQSASASVKLSARHDLERDLCTAQTDLHTSSGSRVLAWTRTLRPPPGHACIVRKCTHADER
jgi:hypothetical protein